MFSICMIYFIHSFLLISIKGANHLGCDCTCDPQHHCCHADRQRQRLCEVGYFYCWLLFGRKSRWKHAKKQPGALSQHTHTHTILTL